MNFCRNSQFLGTFFANYQDRTFCTGRIGNFLTQVGDSPSLSNNVGYGKVIFLADILLVGPLIEGGAD